MEYLESIKILKDIENRYDVMSIKYRGISVWPWFRVYLCDSLSANKQQQEISSSNVKLVLKTLFNYNPLKLFLKHKVWTFSSQGGRKLVGSKYVEHVLGGVSELEESTLNVEWPSSTGSKLPKEKLCEKYLFSASWLLLFSHAFEVLFRLGAFKIERKDIIEEIIKDLNIKFDYRYFVRFLLAQKVTMDFMLLITNKPRVVFYLCPCTCMGYIWSLHNHRIPVVEMQHGVLNADHYAYNSKFHSDIFYPDQICVYGEDEYYYFTEGNPNFCSKITKTGSYILEKSNMVFSIDIFKDFRNKFSTIVVVSGQTPYEKYMSDFVKEVAKIEKETLFVYIPRLPETKLSFEAPNIIYRPGVNIYEFLKWCDVHMTISSSTFMESQFFFKPTIFYNFENRPLAYYGSSFTEVNGAFYLDDPNEFPEIKEKIKHGHFKYRDIYTHGHMELLKKVMMEYIDLK